MEITVGGIMVVFEGILVIKGGNFGPGRGEFWSKSVFFGVRTKVSKVCSEILHYFQGGQRGIIYAGG